MGDKVPRSVINHCSRPLTLLLRGDKRLRVEPTEPLALVDGQPNFYGAGESTIIGRQASVLVSEPVWRADTLHIVPLWLGYALAKYCNNLPKGCIVAFSDRRMFHFEDNKKGKKTLKGTQGISILAKGPKE